MCFSVRLSFSPCLAQLTQALALFPFPPSEASIALPPTPPLSITSTGLVQLGSLDPVQNPRSSSQPPQPSPPLPLDPAPARARLINSSGNSSQIWKGEPPSSSAPSRRPLSTRLSQPAPTLPPPTLPRPAWPQLELASARGRQARTGSQLSADPADPSRCARLLGAAAEAPILRRGADLNSCVCVRVCLPLSLSLSPSLSLPLSPSLSFSPPLSLSLSQDLCALLGRFAVRGYEGYEGRVAVRKCEACS